MILKNLTQFLKSNKIFIFIFILAIFFRFYQLQERINFGMDQENEIFIVRNIVQGKHFPLIGLSIADTGIYRGPLFLYVSVIPYILFNGNPLGGAILSSLLGVITTVAIFFIGKRMFSKKVATIASLIYACSLLISFYERQFWNPSFIPLLSIIIGYFSFKAISKKSKTSFFLMIMIFGFALHAHATILIFLPLIAYTVYKMRKNLSIKHILYSFFILLVTQVPIILFDLRHDFLNTKALFYLLSGSNISVYTTTLIERLSLFLSMLGRIFWLPNKTDLFLESGQCRSLTHLRYENVLLGIILFISSTIMFTKKIILSKTKSLLSLQILLVIFLSSLIYIIFFSRNIFEYYYLYFFPWIVIVFGLILDELLYKKYGYIVVIFVVGLIILLNLSSLFSSYNSYPYLEKVSAISYAKDYIERENFNLEALGDCPKYGGYRYLFEYFGKKPGSSYMDLHFSWLYGEGKKIIYPKTVTFSTIDEREGDRAKIWKEEEEKLQKNVIAKKQFGNIRVYVTNNE